MLVRRIESCYQRFALASEDLQVDLDESPDQLVIHGWILMRQAIPKVDDSPCAGDGIEYFGRLMLERQYGLTDDGELPFHRGAHEPVTKVVAYLHSGDCGVDGVARLKDIGKISARLTLHRAAASSG